MILRLPAVMAKFGLARSTLYKAVAARTLTHPIRLSARAVGWPSHECEAILAARIAGKTDDDVHALVIALEAARKDAGIVAA